MPTSPYSLTKFIHIYLAEPILGCFPFSDCLLDLLYINLSFLHGFRILFPSFILRCLGIEGQDHHMDRGVSLQLRRDFVIRSGVAAFSPLVPECGGQGRTRTLTPWMVM